MRHEWQDVCEDSFVPCVRGQGVPCWARGRDSADKVAYLAQAMATADADLRPRWDGVWHRRALLNADIALRFFCQ